MKQLPSSKHNNWSNCIPNYCWDVYEVKPYTSVNFGKGYNMKNEDCLDSF